MSNRVEHLSDTVTIICADCRDVLPTIANVDAVVTDPPYGLRFMGKAWDYDVPDADLWRLVFDACKPGAHLLSFAGARTQHRMAVNIEDAGFEIRDMIAWVYGSGFPKSLDVSKAIDKAAGAEREVTGSRMGDVGIQGGNFSNKTQRGVIELRDSPATDAARGWQGWGTALKPAMEPITIARRPLDGTVAENVLAHGTGAINVGACRVEGGARPLRELDAKQTNNNAYAGRMDGTLSGGSKAIGWVTQGRWPANLIHDGSEEVLAGFPPAPGQNSSVTGREPSSKTRNTFALYKERTAAEPRGDSGSAARFFYCAKASKADRDEGCDELELRTPGECTDRTEESAGLNCPRAGAGRTNGSRNHHPTVKPTALMRYLCRLVTPPGGLVIDPFMGSGSTGKAAIAEGFRFIGVEKDPASFEIARARLLHALEVRRQAAKELAQRRLLSNDYVAQGA